MLDGFTETQIISALVVLVVGSYAAFFGWIVSSIHRLDRKIDARIDALDRKFDAKFDAVNARLETLAVAVARLEGAVYHGLPEPRRAIQE
jgi:hypothetical protein